MLQIPHHVEEYGRDSYPDIGHKFKMLNEW